VKGSVVSGAKSFRSLNRSAEATLEKISKSFTSEGNAEFLGVISASLSEWLPPFRKTELNCSAVSGGFAEFLAVSGEQREPFRGRGRLDRKLPPFRVVLPNGSRGF
jgi:hypothetical protein